MFNSPVISNYGRSPKPSTEQFETHYK